MLLNFVINPQQVTQTLEYIFSGGYGKVYKAISLKDANEYALKRLFVPEDAVKKVQYEISLSRKLSGGYFR